MLADFADRARRLRTVADYERLMAAELGRLGFEQFAYLALRVPGSRKVPFVITTYSQDWAARYAERDYVDCDPVLERANASNWPFDWRALTQGGELGAASRRVMDEGAEHGLRAGATVPLHSSGGGFAALSVAARGNPRAFQDAWRANWAVIQQMALSYHFALEENLLHAAPLPRTYLTEREREALLWTAGGKTAWETSEIMKISVETVNFHLKNVMRKVGVYSKHHAVVKAIMMGLIVPDAADAKARGFQGNVVNLPSLGATQSSA